MKSEKLDAAQLPNLAITPGDYLERYLVEYQEVDLVDRAEFAQHYRFYGQNPILARAWLGAEVERLLLKHPGFYVEIRDNRLLAFRPGQDFEPHESIELLLGLVDLVGGASAKQAGAS